MAAGGSFLGRPDLEIEGGRVADYGHQLIEVEANLDPDPAVADLVRQALAPYQEELSPVVGETATALNRATMLETTMDNFLLQAVQESTGAQLAFSNGWGYGAPDATVGRWLQNITQNARDKMKSVSKIIIISVLVMALTSCSAFAPKPTETAVPTATSLPTSTSTPEPTITPTPTEKPTKTPEPTITPTSTEKPTKTPVPPTETPTAPILTMPTGKPVTNWEGVPVMPNAIAGDGDSKGYSFTVLATSDEVQNFYEKEMTKLGWNLFATGQGTTNAILLMFMKGTVLVSVSIVPQTDGLMYVLFVK